MLMAGVLTRLSLPARRGSKVAGEPSVAITTVRSGDG